VSKHYKWQRQPKWPVGIIALGAFELLLVGALAFTLAWRAFGS
jgi:hypothetical protein